MKITITRLRALLLTGTEFTAEFVGLNKKYCKPGTQVTRRRVASCTTFRMISEFRDGPQVGERVYLNWKGVAADRDGNRVTLSADFGAGTEDFLVITLDPERSSVAVGT